MAARGSRPALPTGPGRPAAHLGWIPIALGGVAIVAALDGRKRSAAVLAVAAGTLGTLHQVQSRHAATAGAPEVERSITIGKSVDELRQHWRDPATLPQIMSGFAALQPSGAGRLHWKIDGPLGRACEWDTETLDQSDQDLGWRALAGSRVVHEGSVRFRPAPPGRGTVVTLRLRFEPPGGALGEWLVELLGIFPLRLVADGALRRFKNLVESGEIPTTARQPAARADTH